MELKIKMISFQRFSSPRAIIKEGKMDLACSRHQIIIVLKEHHLEILKKTCIQICDFIDFSLNIKLEIFI